MQKFRLVLFLFLLLTGGSTGYGFTSGSPEISSNKEITAQLSQDLHELSPSRISDSTNFSSKHWLNFFSVANLTEENSRSFSKLKAYLFTNRFIDPGLSLQDIIFPFHIFL